MKNKGRILAIEKRILNRPSPAEGIGIRWMDYSQTPPVCVGMAPPVTITPGRLGLNREHIDYRTGIVELQP